MPTVDTNPTPVSSTTTSLPIDLRSVVDSVVNPGTPTPVIRQVMAMGDPAFANLTARVVRNGVASGKENALAVALVPGAQDLQDIKELLFQILQQLTRIGQALGAGPSTDLVTDPQGVF